jgi:YD repeat-containing protein
MLEKAGQEPVAEQILWRQWDRIGHILWKPESSTTRQSLTWDAQGKRKGERPVGGYTLSQRWDIKGFTGQQQ